MSTILKTKSSHIKNPHNANNSNISNTAVKKKIDITKYTLNSHDKAMTLSSNESSNKNQLPIISNSKSLIEIQNSPSIIKSSKLTSSKSKSFNVVEIKNMKNIRIENSTLNNNLISISQKNLDLKKIIEKEKYAEMQKYHFLENFFDGNNLQYDQERIFYNDPFENLDEDLIKYRHKFILRSSKLLMDNKMHFPNQNNPNYLFRKFDSEKLCDINKKVKLNLLEKSIENKNRIIKEAIQKEILSNNRNNYINENTKGKESDIYGDVNNKILGTTNFLKENINTTADTNSKRIQMSNTKDLNKNYDIKFTENNLQEQSNNLFNKINQKKKDDNNYKIISATEEDFERDLNYRSYNNSKRNTKHKGFNDNIQIPSIDLKTESTNLNKNYLNMNIENNEFNNTNPNKDLKVNFGNTIKSKKSFFQTTSHQFFDEEKIQNLDDSGVLKPAKYENVYFKSMQFLNEKQENMPNPNPEFIEDKDKSICLNDVEPNHKTKLEVENIKKGLKDIMRRRFDFSDEYLNDVHKRMQKKKIDFDPEYQNVKNKYEQYRSDKIIAKKDHNTAMKLHLMNRNPILQVNNLVAFPNIVNDPMLLASLYDVNMYNLEFSKMKNS